jgi:hypothetical protein
MAIEFITPPKEMAGNAKAITHHFYYHLLGCVIATIPIPLVLAASKLSSCPRAPLMSVT